MFIPLSYLQKEADHIEGFAKECAVVTHHRLAVDSETGQLTPTSPLEEPLVIRPTSETIIGKAFSRWIQSYRDLPLMLNQWANIVRWEMRTRLFLRTSEFLWQEGHTAHATHEEAVSETLKMLDVYREFCETHMSMPVVTGLKSANERFPGAEDTYCIEAMMQDGKALQSGTSHFLGQNFSKSFDIGFLSESGERQHVWTTSWGVSTRLMGALIMTHSDDDGLVCPPRLAPHQVVILPVYHKSDKQAEIDAYCETLKTQMSALSVFGEPIRVKIDYRDARPGDKAWSWVKKGVPIRLEIGPREWENQTAAMRLRTEAGQQILSQDALLSAIPAALTHMQQHLLDKATAFRAEHSVQLDTPEDFHTYFKSKDAGFAYAYWAEDDALEEKLKRDYKVTIRCYPLETLDQTGPALFDHTKVGKLAIFAKAY